MFLRAYLVPKSSAAFPPVVSRAFGGDGSHGMGIAVPVFFAQRYHGDNLRRVVSQQQQALYYAHGAMLRSGDYGVWPVVFHYADGLSEGLLLIEAGGDDFFDVRFQSGIGECSYVTKYTFQLAKIRLGAGQKVYILLALLQEGLDDPVDGAVVVKRHKYGVQVVYQPVYKHKGPVL